MIGKKRKSMFLIIILPALCFGQINQDRSVTIKNKGIHWINGLTWKQIKEKAKKEKKMIFLDCFATWCNPCKKMDMNVYSLEGVGRYYNDRFICVRVQMDRTNFDDSLVKSWYSSAKEIQTYYSVNSFPTFLFFSPDALPLHKISGYFDSDSFLEIAENAVDPNKQYYSILAKFEPGELNIHELKGLARAFKYSGKELAEKMAIDYLSRIPADELTEADNLLFIQQFMDSHLVNGIAENIVRHLKKSQIKNSKIIKTFLAAYKENPAFCKASQDYINSLSKKEVFKKENIELITVYTKNTEDKGFSLFYNNAEKINNVVGKKRYAQKIVGYVISKETIDPFMKEADQKRAVPDWDKLFKIVASNYSSDIAKRTILDAKIRFYHYKNNWDQYIMFSIEQVKTYGSDTTNLFEDGELNNLAWKIFLHSNDSEQLKTSLDWVEGVIRRGICQPISTAMDTYANILYKMGKVDEAILQEEKALSLSPFDSWKKDVLSKMRKGVPTWETSDE